MTEFLIVLALLAVIAGLSMGIILLLANLGAYFMKVAQGTTAFVNVADNLSTIVPNVGGYLVVSVTINGKKTCRTVHSLVAEAFIGRRPSDLLVLHKNGCKLENRATNLYYGTQKQNMQDAVAHGTKPRGATHGMVKLTEAQVSLIRSLKGAMKQRDIAHKFGIGQSHVQRILSGQSWAHVDGAE